MYTWYEWSVNDRGGTHIRPRINSLVGLSHEVFYEHFPDQESCFKSACGKPSRSWNFTTSEIEIAKSWLKYGHILCKECVKMSDLSFDEYLTYKVING